MKSLGLRAEADPLEHLPEIVAAYRPVRAPEHARAS
jgi:hypothetical protein